MAPKGDLYYWKFLKIFGRECYTTWREELLTTLLLAIAAFALTRKYDPAAQSSLQTAIIAAAIVLAVFVLFHIVHTPLLLHKATRARKALPHPGFGVLGIAVLIGMMGGGYEFYERVWPGKPPSHSKNRLHWADAGVFSDNRSIEAGKTIVFRFQFTPNEGLVTNTHIVGACVVTEGPTSSQDSMMITRFQDMVKENLQGAESAQGPEVASGIFVYEDVPCSAFSVNQADKVLSGSGRVYILLWLGWIGQDGVKDEVQYCFWLEHPEPILSEDDAKRWKLCNIPVVTQPLW